MMTPQPLIPMMDILLDMIRIDSPEVTGTNAQVMAHGVPIHQTQILIKAIRTK